MLYFIILIGILTALYWMLKVQYQHWEKRNIFHPKFKLLYGNISGGGFFMDIKLLYESFKQYKPLFGFYFYTKPFLMITDLNLVKNILIKDFDYFQNRGGFCNTKADPLTGHLINLEGDHWKSLRAKLTPTFSSGKMRYMFPTVRHIGERLITTLNETILQNEDQAMEIELKNLMSRYTTDVIGTTAFGIECNSLKDPNSEFNRLGNDIFKKPRGKLITFLLRANLNKLAKFLNLRVHDKSIIDFFTKLVQDTIKYREENNIKRNDFMDSLIELKNSPNGITFNDILGQCYVFFAAGYETSSSTMTFTLYELAQNQSIQTRVRNEINDILEKHNGELSYDSISEMTYLDQVINESLRLHTPAPIVIRIANKDYNVPDSNYVIEKGTIVFIPYGQFHLDSDYYPNPKLFDPERFNAQNATSRHPMAYLPFGDGPRNCIGMRFGKMESKIGLVLLLKNFNFSNCSKTQIPIELSWKSIAVLQPAKLWLKVEPINAI